MVYLASIRGKKNRGPNLCATRPRFDGRRGYWMSHSARLLNMERPNTISQVKNGLRLAALILIGFVVAAMFFGGVMRLYFLGVAHRSSWSGHFAIVTSVFLLVSVPIMFVTMNRWVKVMAGFLGLAVLNGLISLATGHVLANPTMRISHPYALSLTLFFAVAAVLAGKLKNRTLGVVNRVSVMAFLFSLGILISYQGQRELTKSAPLNNTYFILMGICLCCLLIAWWYGRLQRRSGHIESVPRVI